MSTAIHARPCESMRHVYWMCTEVLDTTSQASFTGSGRGWPVCPVCSAGTARTKLAALNWAGWTNPDCSVVIVEHDGLAALEVGGDAPASVLHRRVLACRLAVQLDQPRLGRPAVVLVRVLAENP